MWIEFGDCLINLYFFKAKYFSIDPIYLGNTIEGWKIVLFTEDEDNELEEKFLISNFGSEEDALLAYKRRWDELKGFLLNKS